MPQVQKPEVRERIIAAALGAFARAGYAATTMNDIARAAGMAVANLYRYYGSKEELFEAAVPQSLVDRFDGLLEKSVQAHADLAGLTHAADSSGGRELLELWIDQRLAVVILLVRAQGSPHERFPARFTERLVALTIAEIQRAHPALGVPKEARLVLREIFENTRRMLGAILQAYEDEPPIRRAVAAFRSYQVAGLAAFTRSLVSEAAARSR
jgi:AcrR family transcriptional regulator